MSFGDSVRKSMDNELLDNRDPNALPNGKYTVLIESGAAFTSRAGDDYAKVTLEILEGPVEGRFEHFMGFNSPVQEQINGETLASYGVDWTKIDSLTDLDLQLSTLTGTRAEIGVSWNDKGFLNINVHRSWAPEPKSDIPTNGDAAPATSDAQSSFAAAAGAKADDEVPF
jgi:hypothetical protein